VYKYKNLQELLAFQNDVWRDEQMNIRVTKNWIFDDEAESWKRYRRITLALKV